MRPAIWTDSQAVPSRSGVCAASVPPVQHAAMPAVAAIVPSVPAGTRVYAIGDIHGRADLVGVLHGRMRDDAATAPERRRVVVYLGDYVDRGPDSRGAP